MVGQAQKPAVHDPFRNDPFWIEPSSLPKLYRVTQHFDAPVVRDIPGAVKSELARIGLAEKIRPGMRVAVTAGSRGVANIPIILRAVVECLRDAGASPIVLPTMGSHGGGTADGQREMLASLGVTEESVGCPILATMDVVPIGETPVNKVPVFLDRHAAESDGIVVVGRVKQHTDFDAPIESGLHKMMAIGLGKHKGAIDAHRRSITIGFPTIIPEVGQVTLHNTVTPILAGVALVENAYDQTAIVEAVRPEDFVKREKALLVEAKRLIGKLPFDQIDVLIVDEAGKNISGNGLDTNVTGRVMMFNAVRPASPRITRIILRGLTPETHGNATGIGQVDFVLKRAADQIDWHATYTNCLTGLAPEYAQLPVVCHHDHNALSWAIHTSGRFPPKDCRIVWIRNSLELSHLYVSEALLAEATHHPRLEVEPDPISPTFDAEGYLPELLRG
jgi:Domain of unknown function (DUF362)